MSVNPFIGLTVAQLESLQTKYLTCLENIAEAHQSYSIAGRTFTRADLDKVKETLGQIGQALEIRNGNLHRVIYSDMSGG